MSDHLSSVAAGWRLENSYAQLPRLFYSPIIPTPVRKPGMAFFNSALATSLGLNPEALGGETGAAIFAGTQLPEGSTPIAQAYAGHQFGHFTTLGDGRAILLGEQLTPAGKRLDIQLKGAGPTPYSRRGDGRAALGPMLREAILSEAMHAFGIPTTRSLAVATTGEPVYREEPLPGAVLTRVAASHIRVGTFEWAAAAGDAASLSTLINYTLQRHYPEAADCEYPSLALLEAAIESQASLLAKWMLVGFVHGVMNTDNMALSGETIDYGPCAFLDSYDPATVFSSIDRQGRYAYANQPLIAEWNLTRLAEALLCLPHPGGQSPQTLAEEALSRFQKRYQHHWLCGMRKKLGLFTEELEDRELAESLLSWMHSSRADFTNTFAGLSSCAPVDASLPEDDAFRQWQQRWFIRLEKQPQSAAESLQLRQANNPAIIPRNHLVEEALTGDISVTEQLLAVLSTPYDHTKSLAKFRTPAPPEHPPYRTFCGT